MRSPFKRYGRGLATGGPILNLASAAGATPLAPTADVPTSARVPRIQVGLAHAGIDREPRPPAIGASGTSAGAASRASAADVCTDGTCRSISEHDLTVVEPRIEAVLRAEYDHLACSSPAGTSNLYAELPCGHLKPFPWNAALEARDPDDATAPEGHAVASALAADRQAARLVRDAGELVEFAEASLVRALQMLSCVGAEDPMRPLIDRVFIETTRVKNELVGVVEKFHQVGVGS